MKTQGLKYYLKTFLFEIIAFIVFALILIQLLNTDFTGRLITGFTYLRPEYTFNLFVIFSILTLMLGLLLFMQVRKKKLKSVNRLSPFTKTVVRSHKVREMSQTQIAYTAQIGIIDKEVSVKVPFTPKFELAPKLICNFASKVLHPEDANSARMGITMPKDIEDTNPNVVELYFTYEERLKI